MWRRWLVGGVVVGLLATSVWAKPGSVRTKDGTVYSGEITEDAKFVTIKDHGVSTTIDKRNVLADGILYTATLDEQFNERRLKLAPSDVKGRLELARWATQSQRSDLAVKALEEAVKIDPANREAALQLDTAIRQVDLEKRQHTNKPPDPKAATKPASPPAASVVNPPPGAPTAPAPQHRLLNAEEVNLIRQKELLPDDTKLRVQIAPDAVKRYLSTGDKDADAFRKMAPFDQALEILKTGDAKLASEVRIMTDPAPLLEFKTKVSPLVATACGSSACHGGTHAGDFHLFSGESPNIVYTNFYILQTYTKSVGGTQYAMMDRTLPSKSLILQYTVPASESEVAHPQVPNFRPRFRSKSDPGFKQIADWLANALNPIAPSYGIKLSAKLPATQPVDGAGGPAANPPAPK